MGAFALMLKRILSVSLDWRLFLDDMIESIGKVLDYTDGLDQSTFLSNNLVYDATLRNFEILGEATKHIPDSVKEAYPEIEWRRIKEFRNFVSHAYFKIDPDILWDVVSRKLPELSIKLRQVEG